MYNKVFISHAKEDSVSAEELYDFLKSSGYNPWLDKKDISVGQKWESEIMSALKKADFIILLLSKTSVAKRGYVQKEFRLALEYCEEKLDSDIFIIPCKIDNCEIPGKLSIFQWVEIADTDSFKKILSALNLQRKKYEDYDNGTNVAEKGIVINGVKWATCNVDKPGIFADKPEDTGMLYQWNCKTGWPAILDWESLIAPIRDRIEVPGWYTSILTSDTWEKANDPSPAGWRLPTFDEIEKLLDTEKVSNEWTISNGKKGIIFTDKSTSKSIFLPAAGWCNQFGYFLNVIDLCGYWGSTLTEDSPAGLWSFFGDEIRDYIDDIRFGLSVRPVAE